MKLQQRKVLNWTLKKLQKLNCEDEGKEGGYIISIWKSQQTCLGE